jgi:hypothetical protein
MAKAFSGCTNLTGINANAGTPDLTNVSSMSEMFRSAFNFNADLNN